MLDRLRQQIQTLLDELLGEADKLRRALAALGSRDRAATARSGCGYKKPFEHAGWPGR